MKKQSASKQASSAQRPSSSVQYLTEAGIVAALYTALTLALPVASFGPIQFRLSEALTVLPVFLPSAISGLGLGCLLSNLLGLTLGANVAGAWDLLVGTAATLLAAWGTYALRGVRFRSLPLLSVLPPIVLNALLVGGELSLATLHGNGFWLCVAQVGIGEAVTAGIGGILLFSLLRRTRFGKYNL